MKTICTCIVFFLQLHFIMSQWEPMEGPYGGYINDLATNDTFQFAATPHGIYRTADEGQTWHHLSIVEGQSFACIQIGVFENILLTDAVNYRDNKISRYLFRSDNHGETWTEVQRPDFDSYFDIAVHENGMYVADPKNLWLSTDEGNSWKKSVIDPLISGIVHIGSYAGKVFVNTYDTLYISSTSGDTFITIPIDDTIGGFYVVSVFDSLILAEGPVGKLYRSDDMGTTWSVRSEALNTWTAFAKIDSTYFVNTATTILKSEDEGLTWKNQNSIHFPGITHVLTGAGKSLMTGSMYTGIRTSKDRGKSFADAEIGISACFVTAVAYQNQTLYAASLYKGLTSFDTDQAVWFPGLHVERPSLAITDITFSGDHILVISGPTILRSSDQGNSWIDVSPFGLHSMPYHFYFFKESILAGGTPGSYLIISTDDGASWKQYSIKVDGNNVTSTYLFAYNEDSRFVAKRKVLFRSLDYSITWDTAMNGLILENQFAYIHRLYAFGDTIMALEFNDSSYLFTLNISFDNGNQWGSYGEGIPQHDRFGGISSIVKYDDILLACMYNDLDGIYVSFDFGISWEPFNEGMDLGGVSDITYDDEYLYAATSGQSVWRRKIADLHIVSTTPVLANGEMIIYPNPSSGNIHLDFGSLPGNTARLTIRDVQGRVLDSYETTLFEHMEVHTSHLPAGLYLLSILAGDQLYSGKFIIMK